MTYHPTWLTAKVDEILKERIPARDKLILLAQANSIYRKGQPPSIAELGIACGCTDATVKRALHALQATGLVDERAAG